MIWRCSFLFILLIKSIAQGADSPKIYLALGLHVNTYHSYRDDSNTEKGHGKDIRIIRDILSKLDAANKDERIKKKPKIVWDFDNTFTLEQTLPVEAPEIIEQVKERVRLGHDEVILMSYNNGMASAMTPLELKMSTDWAISNPWQSGVSQIFGKYSPIVRPQEMMFSPGQGEIYKNAGVEAIQLYYSSVPFDAFRLFVPKLSTVMAHNPIRLKNELEDIRIIPTYNIGDLVEQGGIKNWLLRLRDKQLKDSPSSDLLLAINFDADVDFWTGAQVPWYARWIPGTGGLQEIIRVVDELDFVEYTHLNDYLGKHPDAGEVNFQQDTADGSFEGYASWADKLSSQEIWTCIEKSRAVETELKGFLGNDKPTDELFRIHFKSRLRLLSTTHFGMATPFVVDERLQKARQLCIDLERSGASLLAQIKDLSDTNLRREIQSVRPKKKKKSKSKQAKNSSRSKRAKPAAKEPPIGQPIFGSVFKFGDHKFDLEGLQPLILKNKTMVADFSHVQRSQDLKKRIWIHSGAIDAQGLVSGRYLYKIKTDEENNIHWLESEIYYPRHPNAVVDWDEIFPAAIRLPVSEDLRSNIWIYRIAFDGKLKKHRLEFPGLDKSAVGIKTGAPNMDSVNNHLVDWLFGVQIGGNYIWMIFDKHFGHSFAPVPLRLEDSHLTLNPFGVLAGEQPKKNFDVSGLGRTVTLAVGEQFKSGAPTFNGGFQQYSFGILVTNRMLESDEIEKLKVLSNVGANLLAQVDTTKMSEHLVSHATESSDKKMKNLPLRLKLEILKNALLGP